jgi:hypothetical protein
VTARDPQQAGTDRREGLAWAGLGAVILVMSLLMDRLPEQGVPPYAAPGLMPGLLGIAMMLFGAIVAMRVERGPGGGERPMHQPQAVDFRRLALVIGLCLTFSVVLIGHGLPFWAASALFVGASILVLRHTERRVARRRLDARAAIIAGVIGLAAGGLATLVFQDLFLVRLP